MTASRLLYSNLKDEAIWIDSYSHTKEITDSNTEKDIKVVKCNNWWAENLLSNMKDISAGYSNWNVR